MSKMDEQVVVFDSEHLTHLDGLPGVAPHFMYQSNLSCFGETIAPTLRTERRGDVEDNSDVQQVIPYVVVCDRKDNFLVYNRGEEGGEKRLANKWSLGFGGHVNREDCPGDFPPSNPVAFMRFMRAAATRELTEELSGWPTPHAITGDAPVSYEALMMLHVAFIQLDDTPVDNVHFGVAMKAFCDIRYLSEIQPNSEIAEVKWVTRQELMKYELEAWSERLKWNL